MEEEARAKVQEFVKYYLTEAGRTNALAEGMLNDRRVLLDFVEILRAFFAADTKKDLNKANTLQEKKIQIAELLRRLEPYFPAIEASSKEPQE